ncbi:MAG: 3-isopropylmalate dehydratase large subunit, partial [Cellvibrionales bacterium]|nr:3-isopropylmalate dehydratase large subunit [Cellvibrionales bacterium]
MGKTLYDKLWSSHLIEEREDGTALIYIDRQLLHEVTSPQAFEGLRMAGRQPWRISANVAVPDHNVSTLASERSQGLAGVLDSVSRIQLQTLDDNCADFGIPEIPL